MTARLAGLLGTIVCLASVMACVPAAVAGPTSAPEPSGQASAGILELLGQTGVVEPDGDLVIRLRVSGAPAGATIRVEVRGAVPTRTDFQASLDGRLLRTPVPGSPVVVPATADATGALVITVPTRDPESTTPVDPSHPAVRVGQGVYPVVISLIDHGATLQQLRTYLIRLPADRTFPPLGVALVVPAVTPIAHQPDGSVQLDPINHDRLLSTAAVLAAHPDVPLTITTTGDTITALDQGVIASLRSATAGRELALVPYVRVHPSDWLDAGLDTELGRVYDLGTQAVASALGALSATDYVADDRLTADAARYLHARGVTSMLIPDDALSPLEERVFNRTLTQPFDLADSNGIEAAAADRALAAHAGSTGDPVVDANHVIADLAVLYFDDPPDHRAIAFTLPDDRPIDPRFLDTLLGSLRPSANRLVQPITLSTLFATVPRVGSRGETSGRSTPLSRALVPAPSDGLGEVGDGIRSAESTVSSYGSMLDSSNPRAADLERRALTAGAIGLSADQRAAYLNGVRDGVRAELAKIHAPPHQTITFTARDGVVSLTLRLATGYPVTVDVVLQGNKLLFPGHEDGRIRLTLTDETTRLPIDVRTRASGDSPLDVTLETPDGGMVIARSRVTVRSTAFSGVGLVLSIGAGGFLAGWWGRHIVRTHRRRRRPRHAASASR